MVLTLEWQQIKYTDKMKPSDKSAFISIWNFLAVHISPTQTQNIYDLYDINFSESQASFLEFI